MSSVYEFLVEATANKFLQTVREQTQVVAREPEDPGAEVDLEDLEIAEAEEKEMIGTYPKKPKRRSSDALMALVQKYEKRACESSDTVCLERYIENQIFTKTSFDFPRTDAGNE